MLEMIGFAVARRRWPHIPKWRDDLINGLNLTPKQFTRASGRLALDDRRVNLRGLPARSRAPPVALMGSFNAARGFASAPTALGW